MLAATTVKKHLPAAFLPSERFKASFKRQKIVSKVTESW